MTIQVAGLTSGEALRAGPMTIRVLEDGSHTSHRLGLVEVTIPPHIDGPPQHLHRQHDETFYVLAGTPTFTSGNDVIRAKPGMLVTAPPGTPHTFANPGDENAVMLCTVTPTCTSATSGNSPASPPGHWTLKSSAKSCPATRPKP